MGLKTQEISDRRQLMFAAPIALITGITGVVTLVASAISAAASTPVASSDNSSVAIS